MATGDQTKTVWPKQNPANPGAHKVRLNEEYDGLTTQVDEGKNQTGGTPAGTWLGLHQAVDDDRNGRKEGLR